MYNAISLTNKNETKCGLQNKNYAKMSLHFRWPKRDETKCYNVISSRLVALLLFCSISVSCDLLQGLSGLPGFRNKTHPIATQTSPIAFRGGFPGKVPGAKYSIPAFQGLNITLLGWLQPADMKNNPRQQRWSSPIPWENRRLGNNLHRRRRRHFLKLHSRHYLEDDNKQS